MKENKMELIIQYFNTMDVNLNEDEIDLLYGILSKPGTYNGFLSEIYVSCLRSQDDQRIIVGATFHRYKIVFEGLEQLRVDHIHKYEGEDGSIDDIHWDWANAETSGHDILKVLNYLQVFSWELS